MSNFVKKDNRGGKREGAGRKPCAKTRRAITVRVGVDTADWVNQQPESQSALVELALLNLKESRDGGN